MSPTSRTRAADRTVCSASGWGVRLGCTDGRGAMICPVCERTVKAPLDPKLGPRVCVIKGHRR